MKMLLPFAAVSEAATGLALLMVPSLVGWLLFGAELSGVAIPVARVLGIALIGIGVACWPGRTALSGMLTYSLLATLYLSYVGIEGQWIGKFLWPAVVVHGILTVLLARAWFIDLTTPTKTTRTEKTASD
jgi:hypothetical protein